SYLILWPKENEHLFLPHYFRTLIFHPKKMRPSQARLKKHTAAISATSAAQNPSASLVKVRSRLPILPICLSGKIISRLIEIVAETGGGRRTQFPNFLLNPNFQKKGSYFCQKKLLSLTEIESS
ncbi:MAG TPA: hypothetical protein PLI34_19775, partial [Saprospiraceae bacterium]|nr:hypothetical protein [Saprospiraceae bacterium]